MSISSKRILVIYYNPIGEDKIRITTLNHLKVLENSEWDCRKLRRT